MDDLFGDERRARIARLQAQWEREKRHDDWWTLVCGSLIVGGIFAWMLLRAAGWL